MDDELQGWAKEKNFVLIPAVARPEPADNWEGEIGYVNLVVDRHFEAPLQADVYLAGAPVMVSETIKVLRAKGVRASRRIAAIPASSCVEREIAPVSSHCKKGIRVDPKRTQFR